MPEGLGYTPPGTVEDIDLARKMAKAETPNRQEAKRLRDKPEVREELARNEEIMANRMAEDVQKGQEKIEEEAITVKDEISALHGLHRVFVGNRTPGVIKNLREQMGVNSNLPSRQDVRGNEQFRAYPTSLPNIYCVFKTNLKTGSMEEFYWHMTDVDNDIKVIN